MDRIAIAGLSLHDTDLSGLEGVQRPPAERESRFLHELADVLGASELVFLATCNRIEIAYAREKGHLPSRDDLPSLREHLAVAGGAPPLETWHFKAGADAVRHLFRVACSLDSLVVGEDQILAQVRGAFRVATGAGLTGDLLRPLFDQAFQIGKRVRSRTELSRLPVSIVSLAIRAVVEKVDGGPAAVGVIGAGKMGGLILHSLEDAGLSPVVVANRSANRAEELAARVGCQALSLEAFKHGDVPVDVLFSATSAPGIVIGGEELLGLARRTPSGRPLIAADLALPRDLEAVEDAQLTLVDLEGLRQAADGNRLLREEAALEAEEMIEAKLSSFTEGHAQLAVAALVEEVQGTTGEILEQALERLFTGRLSGLGEEEREAVERWARSTFGRLSHFSIAAMKRLARSGPGSVDSWIN